MRHGGASEQPRSSLLSILANRQADVASDERVVSVDVLRGFDMFWIVGGSAIIYALDDFGSNPVIAFFANQVEHREWEGFVFEDFIFPLFAFLVGMAVVFSVGKIIQREGKVGAYRRIFKRFALMFLLGIFYNGGFSHGLDGLRLMGVLQRLALCYLATALLFCHFKPKALIGVCAALLLGYWAWLSFVPVPGLGTASFAKDANWSNYIDSRLLPFSKTDGTWDAEGLLSTLPAIGTCLLGAFAGLFLKNLNVPANRKGLYLIGVGVLGICAGYLWGLQFPIIKKIWTSSFVILAGGYSCLALGIFYQIIDVWKIRAWTTPFLWIGSNALAIYLVCNIVKFEKIAGRLIGEGYFAPPGGWGSMSETIIRLGLVVLLAGFLYRKKIFIRI
jgi:predicted acyltransferase